jgi:Zn-finger nucleic acid-binding protein
MTELDRQGITIDRCDSCRGVWLDRGELEKLIDREAASEAAPRAAPRAAPAGAPAMASEPPRHYRRPDSDHDHDDDDDARDRRHSGGKRRSGWWDIFD